VLLWGLLALVQRPIVESGYDVAEAEGRVVDGGFELVGWREAVTSWYFREFWFYVGPAALLSIGLLLWLRARRRHAPNGAASWLVAAAVLLVLHVPLGYWLMDTPLSAMLGVVFWFGGSSLFAAAVLMVAWRHRDLALAVCAVVIGFVLTLAFLGFFSNRMYEVLLRVGVDSTFWRVDWGAIAVLLLGVGLLAAAVASRRSAAQFS
jgi:hypothetical protein